MIEAVTLSKSDSLTTKQWQNLREVDISGFEFEAMVKVNDYIEVKVASTWLDPKDVSSGHPVEGQHEWLSKLVLLANIPQWGLKMRTFFSYVGETWGADGAVDYEACTRLDLKVSKTLSKGLELQLGSRNILDSDDASQNPISYFVGIDWRF